MYRHIPFTVITLGVGVLTAALILMLGGLLAGWNILAMLTSRTAFLVYTVLFTIGVTVLFKYFYDKDRR
jgi:hypothetical protein